MVNLALWICARFSIAIPYLAQRAAVSATKENDAVNSRLVLSAQRIQAAPPLWQIAVALTPIVVAFFIASSRYADFHHTEVDIIAGMVIGAVFGKASFRLFHMPPHRSLGLVVWGPSLGDGRRNEYRFIQDKESVTAGGKAVINMDDLRVVRRTMGQEGNITHPMSSGGISSHPTGEFRNREVAR